MKPFSFDIWRMLPFHELRAGEWFVFESSNKLSSATPAFLLPLNDRESDVLV